MVFKSIKFIEKKKRDIRKKMILKKCGCMCVCPNCNDPLNDQAQCEDTDFVRYVCSKCGCRSKWSFDIAPVPILLDHYVWIKGWETKPTDGQKVIYFYKYVGKHRGFYDESTDPEDPSYGGDHGGISALGGVWWMADDDQDLSEIEDPELYERLPR